MQSKLIYAVLHRGQSRLDAVVDDVEGHRRKISIRWNEKEQRDNPPKDWSSLVDGEVRFQLDEEKAVASGRILIR